ncbi:amidase, partial [Lactobacillus crispatus]|uniref:hypothetical protein n=1 Tax=Lactobacillus crispatus TaxID=47770 RepID=UPI0010F12469
PSPPRPIRVAVVPDPFGDVDPAVREAVKAAGRWLAEAGYAGDGAMPPRVGEAADLWDKPVLNEERLFLEPAVRAYGDDKSKRNLGGHIA